MNIINGITLIIWQTASCLNSVLVPWTWPTDTQWISIQLMISCPHSLVREIVLKNFITVRLGLPANLDVFPAFVFVKQKPEVCLYSQARFSWKFGTFIVIMWLFSERKELEISVSTESLVVFAEHDEHEVWLITRMRLYRLLYLLVLEPVFLKGMSVSTS